MTTKIDGLIQAIESESRTPSPSHQNLARLVALALREVVAPVVLSYNIPETTNASSTVNTTVPPEIVPPEAIPPLGKTKKGKKK